MTKFLLLTTIIFALSACSTQKTTEVREVNDTAYVILDGNSVPLDTVTSIPLATTYPIEDNSTEVNTSIIKFPRFPSDAKLPSSLELCQWSGNRLICPKEHTYGK